MKLKSGKNRAVFIFKHFVIKIPIINLSCCGGTGIFAGSKYSFLTNIKSNYAEYRAYKLYGKKYKELCPVWFSLFGLINIMPICQENTEEVEDSIIKKYRLLLRDETISNCYNTGKYKGRFVIYDYGNVKL